GRSALREDRRLARAEDVVAAVSAALLGLAGGTPAAAVMHLATTLRGAGVDLIFGGRAQRERVRRSLCQRQLLLQKRKWFQRPKRIFCRYTARTTSSFTSVMPNRPRIFT